MIGVLLALYVPVVHVLDLQGEYTRYVVAGGEQGVSREECRLRLDAWRAENQDGFDALVERWAEEGKYVAVRSKCEVK